MFHCTGPWWGAPDAALEYLSLLILSSQSNVLQVWDGNCWQSLSTSYADITLSDSATSAIKWAQNKMNEENAAAELAKNNPAVKIALDKFKQAEEQLKTTIILSKDDKTTS